MYSIPGTLTPPLERLNTKPPYEARKLRPQQHDNCRSRLIVVLEQQCPHACGFGLDKVLVSPVARIDVIVKIHRATHQSSSDGSVLARLSHQSSTSHSHHERDKEHGPI